MDSEKCSPRLLRGRTRRLACLGLALGAAATAGAVAQESSGNDARPDATVLDAFVANVESLSADFRQETWSADRELLDAVAGAMALKRPNRFYWHQEPPIETIVVADGQALWTYDVELAQVTVTRLEDVSTANLALILSGDQSIYESFDVVRTDHLDGRDWVELEPKGPSADFSSVLIGFSEGLPRQLELVDGLDQTTRIEFSAVVVNTSIDDGLFEFDPPAGTDVIGEID